MERGGLIGLACLVLYVWLAPAHIVDGDNGEFATLAARGGAAHPSGYPLYVLWLRLLAWLPAASPAHAAAIATAVLGAAQMVVLHAACRAWGARSLAASCAVLTFASAPLVLGMYTEAEVFALNGLVVALVLWIAASAGPLRGGWRAFALGLIAGAGMANHMTCTLVTPIGVVGVARAIRESSARSAAVALLGLALGLTPYLYLLIAPVHQGTWGDIEGMSDVVATILRRDYGGPGAFAGPAAPISATSNLLALVHTLGRTWWWLPAIGGAATMLYHVVRKVPGEPRIAWLALVASFVISGPLLVFKFNLEPTGVALAVVNRFHLLPALLLVVPVAVCFEHVAAYVQGLITTRPWVTGTAVAAVFATLIGMSLPHARRVHVPAVEYEIRNTLASLPPNAVIIAATDDFQSGVNYVQLVLGERTDVLYVHWPLMALPWYRGRLAARGFAFDPAKPGSPSVRAAELALAQGRPLFVDHGQMHILTALPSYPYGILMHVLPRGTRPPRLDEQIAINRTIYERFVIPYATPHIGDEWPADVHKKYAWTWDYFGKLLRKAGRLDDASVAFAAAAAIGPSAE